MIKPFHASCARPGGHWLLALVALMLGALLLPQISRATCTYDNDNHDAGVVTLNAGTIVLQPDTPPGTVIFTSNTNAVPPGTPLELDCDGGEPGGIYNQIGGSATPNNYTFPTNVPGISYRILHPDTSKRLQQYPDEESIYGRPVSYSVASNLQLVYTGPNPPPAQATINGTIAIWKVDIQQWVCTRRNNGGHCEDYDRMTQPEPVEKFNLNATITIKIPTCNVDAASQDKTVTLPDILTTKFTGVGPAGSATPFTLTLSGCRGGFDVSATLDTSNKAGITGVIAPTSGATYADNVGVQILQPDGTTPVTFGTPFTTGTTTQGSYTIDLYARYYQTGTPVTAGNVKAVATYTIQYK